VNDGLMDDVGSIDADTEDVLTTSRMTGRSQRIELITRGERRRVWTLDQKRVAVVDSLQPGVRPADVARQHGINASLLYTWRRQMLEGQLGEMPRALPSFARVELPSVAAGPATVVSSKPDPEATSPRACVPSATDGAAGLIEIVLPNGICIRVDAQVDSRALRRVLTVLEVR
jgi:transposase